MGRGILSPIKLMLPPIRQAIMSGFVKIDLNKLIKDNSFLFT